MQTLKFAWPGFNRWLDRRIPRSSEVTLTQRRIFILPTAAGIGFVCLFSGMLIAAINYENNMLFGFSFLLIGIFLICILHTYSNLSGLTLRYLGAESGFAGKHAEFRFLLTRTGDRQYQSIELAWPESNTVTVHLVDTHQQQASLYVPGERRGLLSLDRIKVESRFPLGIFRAWTWLDFDARCLIYPAPLVSVSRPQNNTISEREGGQIDPMGNDEFSGHTEYQPGDSPKLISWSNLARGLPVMTRRYHASSDQRLWINWPDDDRIDTETALSQMCFQVLEAESNAIEYGLMLPTEKIEPSVGKEHQSECLRALALFENAR